MCGAVPVHIDLSLHATMLTRLLQEGQAQYERSALVVDAGIGLPSHAAHAMELGYDAVLLNTAVAKAGDPVAMAGAMRDAVRAGRAAYLADPMAPREMASPSTPVMGKAFLT